TCSHWLGQHNTGRKPQRLACGVSVDAFGLPLNPSGTTGSTPAVLDGPGLVGEANNDVTCQAGGMKGESDLATSAFASYTVGHVHDGQDPDSPSRPPLVRGGRKRARSRRARRPAAAAVDH